MRTLCAARLGPNLGPNLGPPASGANFFVSSTEYAAGVDDNCPRRAFAAPVAGTPGPVGDTLTYRGSGTHRLRRVRYRELGRTWRERCRPGLRARLTSLTPFGSVSWRSTADRWSKVWSQSWSQAAGTSAGGTHRSDRVIGRPRSEFPLSRSGRGAPSSYVREQRGAQRPSPARAGS